MKRFWRIVQFIIVSGLVLVPAHRACAEPTEKERFAKFEELVKAADDEATERYLEEWKAASPGDAELAVATANYHLSQDAGIRISAGPPPQADNPGGDKEVYELRSTQDGRTVGYMGPNDDDQGVKNAVAVLADAVTSFPVRADIWMGLIHLQMKQLDYGNAFETLKQFAEYAHRNPEDMRWRFNEPLPGKPGDFFPEKLHSYVTRAYSDETTEGLEFMLKVARLSQRLYPEHPYAYNDEAAYYGHLEDDERAADALLRAHKVRPHDEIVILNLAATYGNMKRCGEARKYCRLLLDYGKDDELRAAAKELLMEGPCAERAKNKVKP